MQNVFNKKLSMILLIGAIMLSPALSTALEEVGSDSRIRTFVYGKNDVFRITTTMGYQTLIEFEKDEKIKTISLGDSGTFKITPQKNRIFVKALIGGQLTNMIVITNKRHYQIELSSIIDTLDEMMYVVRFYYPGTFEQNDVSGMDPMSKAVNVPRVAFPPQGQQQMSPQQGFPQPSPFGFQPNMINQGGGYNMNNFNMPQSPSGIVGANTAKSSTLPGQNQLNYNYTLTGPEALSPVEVFDDGVRTFFKFSRGLSPQFRLVNPSGQELPVGVQTQDDYFVVEGVASAITVYFGEDNICVYNESINI